jgi:hypothetical protein
VIPRIARKIAQFLTNLAMRRETAGQETILVMVFSAGERTGKMQSEQES